MWSSPVRFFFFKSMLETLLSCPTWFNSFFFASLSQCHCLYFAFHQNIYHREQNHRVCDTHSSSNSVQTAADGVRLESACTLRQPARFSVFFAVWEGAAITKCIMGQFTQSTKDICAYKRTHIAAVTGKPPSFKVLVGRVGMWDCTQCSWLRESGCTSGKHWDAAQQGSEPHLFQKKLLNMNTARLCLYRADADPGSVFFFTQNEGLLL